MGVPREGPAVPVASVAASELGPISGGAWLGLAGPGCGAWSWVCGPEVSWAALPRDVARVASQSRPGKSAPPQKVPVTGIQQSRVRSAAPLLPHSQAPPSLPTLASPSWHDVALPRAPSTALLPPRPSWVGRCAVRSGPLWSKGFSFVSLVLLHSVGYTSGGPGRASRKVGAPGLGGETW